MGVRRSITQYFSKASKLSLRKRFALGLGAMLMPFFLLAGSTYILFEQAISNFKGAQSRDMKVRFSVAELKTHFSKTRPDVNALLIQPGQPQKVEKLKNLHLDIVKEIDELLEHSPSPLQANLLNGISDSWQSVYDEIQSPIFAKKISINQSELLDQIQYDLEEIQQGLDRIDLLLNEIQFEDNLMRARQLQEQERQWIGVITLIAISMALLSAILLSRSVIQSMQILITGLENLSEGELDQRIEWNTDDEFSRIAKAINAMAEKLNKSQQALIEMATIDGLTSVFNRREFNRLLTIEVERSRRDSHPVSMVMVDIDHFKSINDTYGHQSGDDALQWVSALLQREVRPGDIVARYGGEEFALILPNTHGNDAGVVAERIRYTMENTMVPIQKGLTISITASLGCATFPYVGDSEELLMTASDKALYQAKETGRNRVCYAPIDWDTPKKELIVDKMA